MTLQDYRKQQNLRRADVARVFGVDWISVWRWEVGKSRPIFPMMVRIQEWSKGAVTPNDWLAKEAA